MITISTKKVYCIQDYSRNSAFSKFIFKKGNFYDIIISDDPTEFTPMQIFDDDNNTLGFHPTSPFYLTNFKKYFLTDNEYRRKKLIYLNHIQK